MKNHEIAQVIEILVPNAKFVLIGDSLDGLEWLDERPFPSESEFNATLKKLPALIKAEEQAKNATRQAILDRIGLTADELKLIIG
jgi:hypothetical protein